MKSASALPAFQQYQIQFAANIRNPKDSPKPDHVATRRMRVYQQIVFANIESALSNCFPVAKSVIGKRLWQRLIRGFFVHHQSHSPLFRQIPEEFLAYLQQTPNWIDSPALPVYFNSLAHYEWVELAVASSESSIDIATVKQQGDLMEGRVILTPTLKLLSYDYPVHQISPKNKPKQASPAPIYLAVYRDMADEVRFVEINQVTYTLLDKLAAKALSGRAVLTQMADEMAFPAEKLLTFGLPILQDLHQQQLILGTLR
jgi:uncharacterized protein